VSEKVLESVDLYPFYVMNHFSGINATGLAIDNGFLKLREVFLVPLPASLFPLQDLSEHGLRVSFSPPHVLYLHHHRLLFVLSLVFRMMSGRLANHSPASSAAG
jgi:hypothetical protein